MQCKTWLRYLAAGCILGSLVLYAETHEVDAAETNDIDETTYFDIESFFDEFELTEEDMYVPSWEESLRSFNIGGSITQIALLARKNQELKNILNTASQLLTTGLYKKTHPMMNRNVLDLPAISYIAPASEPTCTTYVRTFYNHTEAVAFQGRQDTINAVTNLNSPSIIQALEALVNFVAQDPSGTIPISSDLQTFDIPRTLPIFADIELQERRAGCMFEHAFTTPEWSFTVQLPVYYLENNFFADEATQRRIENAPAVEFLSRGSSGGGSSAEEFLKKHLVADRIGCGDLRLTAMHTLHEDAQLQLWGGLEATLPTAFDFSEGLIGGDFQEFPRQPRDITRRFLRQLSDDKDAALAMASNELLGILDRITRIFADRPLGQEHFGIAPICTWYYYGSACEVTGKARIEYLTPRTQTRFFIEPITKEELQKRNYRDPDLGDENFDFLEQQVINMLLPQAYEVAVKPRLSPHASIALGQTYDTWHWHTGFDFWYYQRERIEAPSNIISQKFLNVPAAERPSAYQIKLFSDINADVATNHYVWHVGIAFDGTIAYKSIGQDFTISIYAGTTW